MKPPSCKQPNYIIGDIDSLGDLPKGGARVPVPPRSATGSSVYLCCVLTTCLFLFGASSHPYIPLHFEEMIFPL